MTGWDDFLSGVELGVVTPTMKLKQERDALGRPRSGLTEVTFPKAAVASPLWNKAGGLYDETEEGQLSMNFPCVHFSPVTINHRQMTMGSEVIIPEGQAMAGVWQIDGEVSCSAHPVIGDVVKLRRKQ